MILSPTARLLEFIIRRAKAGKDGERRVGRKYLARRLGRSERTVSRYLAELKRADRLEVRRPRRVRVSRGSGWACVGVNRYRLLGRADPAPHVHNRRSPRCDKGVTSPTSWGGSAAHPGRADALVDPSQRIPPDPGRVAAMIAAVLAADAAP